ncbi:MAG: RNA polymerase sigma factor [Solobacterium sp.]|jgi:RNA polymerase sigma-70 factor (ECF subfamily)|nr:RNA polymerase sigma factor [Solobacterium sp.]
MSEEKNNLKMNEDILIQRIALNDREAFNCLYSRLYRPVYAYALSVLKNKEDAEDVMQDCFLKIRAAAHTYTPNGKGKAWIFTIARNLCRMKFRQKQRSSQIPLEDIGSQLVFEPNTDTSLKLTLETAFRILSDQDHQIILLHAVSDMKFRDIAGIMELPLPTVLSKYHRGLSKLRKELEGKL